MNKLLWIGTGCAIPLLPTLGLLVGSLVPQSGSSGSLMSYQQACGLCVGYAVGCLGPLALIRRYQPTPPPERFIGKSPEYIAVYTDAYKTRTRSLREQYTAAGCGIVCGIGLGIAMIGQWLTEQ